VAACHGRKGDHALTGRAGGPLSVLWGPLMALTRLDLQSLADRRIADAKVLIEAITNIPDGVLQWIKRYW
jgi:hypothetical protein